MVADLGSKSPITAIDGVLNITQHMGEAVLVLTAEFLQPSIAAETQTAG